MDEDLRRCSRCENGSLKINFHKDRKSKDGLRPQCIDCRKKFYLKNSDKIKIYNEQNKERRNRYHKNKRETDDISRLISKTRNRIYESSKGLTKQSSTKEILGIDNELYKKRIVWQMTPEMKWSNIEIDHVKPICMFDLSKDEEIKQSFNWKNTQPSLKEVHQQKGTKFNFLDYQLQYIQAYQFLKLNDQKGLNY